MSAFKSKVYRLETQLGELHQQINDRIELDFLKHAEQIDTPPIERLNTLENIVGQLSIESKNHAILNSDKLIEVITRFRDDVISVAAEPPLESNVFAGHQSDLSWLVSAKASIQTLAAVLKVLSENVLSLNEEIRYWEDILEFDWYVGLYALQTSPFKLWRRFAGSGQLDDKDDMSKRSSGDLAIRPSFNSNIWLRFYASVQRCISPGSCSFRVGISSPLSGSKLEIRRKKRKLKAMRDFNASAIGLLMEECPSFETDAYPADRADCEFANNDLCRRVWSSVGLMKLLLRDDRDENRILEHANDLAAVSDRIPCEAQHNTGKEVFGQPQCVLEELSSILTDLLPKYKRRSAETVVEFGRPSPTVRYWLPLSLTLISATTSLKVIRNIGPVLVDSITNLGTTTIEFWKNWVLDPTWKLIRTIRHDEKSEIALMSKNSLEADRASLERMVVDFVLDRSEQSYLALSAGTIADKVREGDLTPVLRAYEKDLRSPFIGTFRGDLVRALLIQIQKTKVDVEIAMSGIDALLKSQELVFGFVGLTPGLLISYASIRWFFGFLGNRKGFRIGRRQNDLRYALRNIHRILLSSRPMPDGRLTYRNHGLMVCNAEVLLSKAQIILKGEDLRAFREDISDLINENRADQQLQVIERMAWTYSKWTK